MRSLQRWLIGCLMWAAIGPRAHADASNKAAAAEIFFQEGVSLMEAGSFVRACAKFEASQRLDPALGTMLRLADCYDRAGKTASAWAMFQEAASAAAARGDGERQRLAEERHADATNRLSKLKLVLDDQAFAADTTIHLNGVALAANAWKREIPVDAGPQRIEVSAPGRLPWSTVADVPIGPVTREVRVPSLALAPGAQTAPRLPGLVDDPEPRGARRPPLRVLGYVLAGAGAAGVAVGGVLAYRAKDLNEKSLGECRPDDATACTTKGVAQREDARAFANGATAAFVCGAALMVGGVLLAVLSPARDAAPRPARGVRVSAGATAHAGAIHLQGWW